MEIAEVRSNSIRILERECKACYKEDSTVAKERYRLIKEVCLENEFVDGIMITDIEIHMKEQHFKEPESIVVNESKTTGKKKKFLVSKLDGICKKRYQRNATPGMIRQFEIVKQQYIMLNICSEYEIEDLEAKYK